MRKQTKVAAVASAAAMLAIGASMTSFAATGWIEEDGVWYYYDKDGNRVEDEWKKSGDNWYWLDSEEGGAMAVDKLIEDDDDTYYVDANGVMVKNTWVKVVNEDQDDDDDPAEYNYYYMQSNGKAFTAPDDGDTTFKTIDGKRYAFDEDGKMLYGWVNGESERLTGDTDWNSNDDEEDIYYLGEWDDGAMKTGWQKLTVCDDKDDDEEKDFWFWFKSNGKKYTADAGKIKDDKKINGKKYGFDERGVMTYEWTLMASGNDATVSDWRYFSSPEDGARKTKGWFKVVAPSDDNDNVFDPEYEGDGFAQTDSDDEEERWYYADEDGELYEGKIKKIKGKYYGFHPEGYNSDGDSKGGAMLSGLCLLEVSGEDIVYVWDDGMDSDELDDLIDDGLYDGRAIEPEHGGDVVTLFYFGNDEDNDGTMKTGTTTITVDGDSYSFKFDKSGGTENKGRGVTGIDDDKYIYKCGAKIKADSDDKYRVVYASGDTGDKNAVVIPVDSDDLRPLAERAGVNKDGDTVKFVGKEGTQWAEGYKLVNTSGSISDTKTAAKDGADWYFYTKDDRIVMYTSDKTLKGDKDHTMDVELDDWKDWTKTATEDNEYDPAGLVGSENDD